jgi:hypothetical protein
MKGLKAYISKMKMNRYVKISTVMMLSNTWRIFTSISKIAIVQVMVFTVRKVTNLENYIRKWR